jgi:hypothetical protein
MDPWLVTLGMNPRRAKEAADRVAYANARSRAAATNAARRQRQGSAQVALESSQTAEREDSRFGSEPAVVDKGLPAQGQRGQKSELE